MTRRTTPRKTPARKKKTGAATTKKPPEPQPAVTRNLHHAVPTTESLEDLFADVLLGYSHAVRYRLALSLGLPHGDPVERAFVEGTSKEQANQIVRMWVKTQQPPPAYPPLPSHSLHQPAPPQPIASPKEVHCEVAQSNGEITVKINSKVALSVKSLPTQVSTFHRL